MFERPSKNVLQTLVSLALKCLLIVSTSFENYAFSKTVFACVYACVHMGTVYVHMRVYVYVYVYLQRVRHASRQTASPNKSAVV